MATDSLRTPDSVKPHALSRWWLDRGVFVKGLLVLAIPMVAFIAVSGATLVLHTQQQSERRLAVAANSLILASVAALADATDGETGIRGYAATADPEFLEPYNAALARLNTDVDALRAAAAATGTASATDRHVAQVAEIAETLDERFQRLADIRTVVDAGVTGVGLLPSLLAGKEVMNRLRSQLATLTDETAALSNAKSEAVSNLESTIKTLQVSGLVVGVLAGLAGIRLFSCGISRRLAVAADNADRLGQGREFRTTPPADDELGRLGDSLAQAHELLEVRMSELLAARDQALRATAVKNTFLSRTSHELRTPLNAILGFAQLLEMSELHQEDAESVDHILRAGQHLLALINELIETSQIESGELRLSVEPVLLETIAAEVAALITPQAATRAITVNSGGRPTLAVLADQQRLRQVLVNLASNAVKYNRHGGTITIGYALAADEKVAISVTDTGPGLTPEEIHRIFAPFERLEAGRHGIEGTGIGLPLALAMTQAMQGTLDVSSTPGQGSTFTVRLPRAPDQDPEPDRSVPVPRDRSGHYDDAAAGKPLVVLSIDDNPANSLLLNRFFAGRPRSTFFSADSAHLGIDMAHYHLPDLILLDLHLPDMSGEEVLARLRAEPLTAKVPIVVLSADATVGSIRRLLTRGAAAYLTKPLQLAELERVLEERVESGRRCDPTARAIDHGEWAAQH